MTTTSRCFPCSPSLGTLSACLALAFASTLGAGSVHAQTTGGAVGSDVPVIEKPAPATPVATIQVEATPTPVTLELNRLESVDNICRSYFVVGNNLAEPLRELQLDTFFFGPDDVVRQRVALTFENVRAEREKVVLFDLDLACDDIGSILVNELLACTAESGPVAGCADTLAVSSRTDRELRY